MLFSRTTTSPVASATQSVEDIDSFINSCLFLYVSSALLTCAILFSRRQYSTSEHYRSRMKQAGFFETPADASRASAARVMRELLAYFPSTVSEMVHDQDELHGAIFKALGVTAGVLLLKVDLNVLSPQPLPVWLKVLNTLRDIDYISCIFGLPFIPVWKDWFDRFSAALKKHGLKVAHWPHDECENAIRNFIFGVMHNLFALPLFSVLPLIDLFLTARSIWLFHPGVMQITACDVAWLAIRLTRILIAIAGLSCLTGLLKHIKEGILYPGESAVKSFWFECRAVLCQCHMMLLLPFEALFDGTHAGRADQASPAVRTVLLGLAAVHVVTLGWMALRSLWVRLTDTPYTERGYAQLFREWKAREETFRQQAQLLASDYDGVVDSAQDQKLAAFIAGDASKLKWP